MTNPLSLPVWPPETDVAFFGSAARAFNQLKSLGASNPVALGIVAQAEAESAFKISALGDKGTAYGIFQMHSDRCAVIKEKTGIDLTAFPPLEKQIYCAWWELTEGPEKSAWAKISKAATAMEAGQLACQFWERAGAANAATRRGLMAERWADLFTKQPDLLAENPALQP